jgi:6,7-dimethyl-8-ribityllumazine synthase
MSKAAPSRSRVDKRKRTFCIVASRFNAQYVDGLVDHATEELRALVPEATISLYRVPGAFEIPVVVREVASRQSADAIIACGVILQGETNHAQNLSRSVTDALQRIAIEHGIPVINAVLSFDNEGQARERCLETKINRGTEAARAAVEIANVLADLRIKQRAVVSKRRGTMGKRRRAREAAIQYQGAAVSRPPRDDG